MKHKLQKKDSTKVYLPHTWVDPRIVVRESSIEGKGLFASEPIQKGEVVMIWGGQLILDYEDGKYRDMTLVPIDDGIDLGLPISDTTESIDEYLNHSCDPSAWLIDEVTLTARRDIKAEEEITVDAATWDADKNYPYTEDGVCHCRSLLCRKTLTADDWMRPELQKRYQGHFSPYIQRKIDGFKIDVASIQNNY